MSDPMAAVDRKVIYVHFEPIEKARIDDVLTILSNSMNALSGTLRIMLDLQQKQVSLMMGLRQELDAQRRHHGAESSQST